jgi:uncharacterized membrane protein
MAPVCRNHSHAFGINDAHAVVGQSQINEGGWTAGYPRAFYLPYDGSMLEMGLLTDAVSSAAYDINNNGLIVGKSQFSGGWYNYRAWVGVAGFTGLVNLNDVTDLNGIPYVSEALSANDRDVIAGIMMYNSGTLELHGVLLLPNE